MWFKATERVKSEERWGGERESLIEAMNKRGSNNCYEEGHLLALLDEACVPAVLRGLVLADDSLDQVSPTLREWGGRVVDLVQDSCHTDATHGHQLLYQEFGPLASNSVKEVQRVVSTRVIVLPDISAIQLVHEGSPFQGTQGCEGIGGWVLNSLGRIADCPIGGLVLPNRLCPTDHVLQIGLGVVVIFVLDVFLVV
jgi:hypothetical protein